MQRWYPSIVNFSVNWLSKGISTTGHCGPEKTKCQSQIQEGREELDWSLVGGFLSNSKWNIRKLKHPSKLMIRDCLPGSCCSIQESLQSISVLAQSALQKSCYIFHGRISLSFLQTWAFIGIMYMGYWEMQNICIALWMIYKKGWEKFSMDSRGASTLYSLHQTSFSFAHIALSNKGT